MINKISFALWVGIIAVLVGVFGTVSVALWASHTEILTTQVYDKRVEEAILNLEVTPQLPNIPDRSCGDIRDFGAISSNGTRTTQAITEAIKVCGEAGGGRITISPGAWEIYPFSLESYVELFFEDGAKFVFGDDLNQYGDPILWRFEGVRMIMTPPLISCVSCHDISIRGNGIIFGNSALWDLYTPNEFWWLETIYNESENREDVEDRTQYRLSKESLRPEVIGFMNSAHVVVEDITIKDAPRTGMRVLMSTDVKIEGVSIATEANEGDALVLDGSSKVSVQKSEFSSLYGEGVELQSGLNAEGNGMDEYPLSLVQIKDISIPQARNALSINRAMSGGINRVVIDGIEIKAAETAVSAHIPQDVSGTVSHVAWTNIHAQNISKNLIFVDLAYPDDMVDFKHDERVPTTFHNLYFSDISSDISSADVSFRHINHPRVNAWAIFWEGEDKAKEH